MELITPSPVTMPLTDRFRTFYDPCRNFGREQAPELIEWLCAGRSALDDPEDRRREGVRILAIELAHTRLIGAGMYDNASALGLGHSELDTIVGQVYEEADFTVGSLGKAVKQLFSSKPEIANRAEQDDPQLIVTYAAMGSALAHYGQKRRSGADYATHPWESVLVAEAAEKKAFRTGRPDEYDLRSSILKYIIYGHDELEDYMLSKEDERNRSFLVADSVLMTPLVHYKLLQALGVDEPVADYVSTGLMRLTKTVGQGGRRTWREYIRELSMPAPVSPSGYEGTVTAAKVAEMHHNAVIDREDPNMQGLSREERKRARAKYGRKTSDYNWARKEMERYADELSGYSAAVLRCVKGVTKRDIESVRRGGSFVYLLEPADLVAAYFAANQAA